MDEFAGIVGAANVLTGGALAKYSRDWMGVYEGIPSCVLRPGSTAEVSAILKLTSSLGLAVVPIGGNTGLNGAAIANGQVMISLERMNRIRDIRVESRVVVVEPGVILTNLHQAVEAQDLLFPLYFGARGSAMVGGVLSTNAGGSNVLRYGSTRALCLGLEVVLPDGRVMNLMSELHKDNSGYDLKDLFIGAEGTLGIITGAVFRLFPKPKAYATALIAMDNLDPALALLNRLKEETGGAIEAFEYMPNNHMARLKIVKPDLVSPIGYDHAVNILVEVGATAGRDAFPDAEGRVPVQRLLEDLLAEMAAKGEITDAVLAQNEGQRRTMWAMREAAAELMHGLTRVDNDICVPLDKVTTFLARAEAELPKIDPGVDYLTVCHLGDGNLHFGVLPQSQDPSVHDAIREKVEEIVLSLGGSFSAEHGIGLYKLNSMRRRKDPVALDVMRAIKAALDPKGLMNPGKVLP